MGLSMQKLFCPAIETVVFPVDQFFFFFFFFDAYLFLRERERDRAEQGRGRERGRHRIWSRLQALSCQHRARRGAQTSQPWDPGWAKVRRLTHWATQALLQWTNSVTWFWVLLLTTLKMAFYFPRELCNTFFFFWHKFALFHFCCLQLRPD